VNAIAERVTSARPRTGSSERTGDRAERIKVALAKLGFGVKARARFYLIMANFLERGNTHRDWLDTWSQRLRARGDMMYVIVDRWRTRMGAGQKFSVVLAPYISPHERMLVAAGEEAGEQWVGLREAAFVATSMRELKSAVISALVYPVFIALLALGLMVGIGTFLVPLLREINDRPQETWPLPARIMVAIGDLVANHWILIIIASVGACVAFFWSLPRWNGRIRTAFDKYAPPYKVYRQVQAASFLMAIGALNKSGSPFGMSLLLMQRTASPWLQYYLAEMQSRLAGGKPPHEAIDSPLLDAETLDAVHAYSKAGNPDEALTWMGRDAVKDTTARVNTVMRAINGMLIFLAGGLLILIASGVLLTMFQVADGMQAQGLGTR